jgi:hypothetical protein
MSYSSLLLLVHYADYGPPVIHLLVIRWNADTTGRKRQVSIHGIETLLSNNYKHNRHKQTERAPHFTIQSFSSSKQEGRLQVHLLYGLLTFSSNQSIIVGSDDLDSRDLGSKDYIDVH